MTPRTDTTAPPGLHPEHFRHLAHEAVDLVADYLAGIAAAPGFTPMTPAERTTLMQEPLAAAGVGPEVVLERFRAAVLPHAMGNGHPRFFGWVNSPPAPIGVIADFLAAALNPSCAGGDHAAIYVERAAVRWLMELIEFPTEGSMGLLVSGGSAATLVALAAARHRAALEGGWNIRTEGLQRVHPALRLYVTADGHSCIQKAAEILGLGVQSIRKVATDERHRMEVGALRAAVAADRAAGDRPFCVAASAGTVGTGAIDPLDEIADLCAAEHLWLHVDGVRDLIARHLALAQHLAGLVDAAPDLERLGHVELSIVCFRYAPPRLKGDDHALDALNKRVMEDVQASGAAFLTQTTLDDRFALRACVLHYATTESDLAALVDAVREAGARLTPS